jgi:hypothetical protein
MPARANAAGRSRYKARDYQTWVGGPATGVNLPLRVPREGVPEAVAEGSASTGRHALRRTRRGEGAGPLWGAARSGAKAKGTELPWGFKLGDASEIGPRSWLLGDVLHSRLP